eukprot:70888_1
MSDSKSKKWKNNNKNKFKHNNKSKRKKYRSKKTNKSNNKNDSISKSTMKDPRFKKVFTDPRFKSMPQTQKDPNKIQVDSRFSSMFTDPAFRTGYRIDRYGREITNNEAYDLHKFYELDKNTNNIQNEGYEAELEQEDDEESKHKLNKAMQKKVEKFKKGDDDMDENEFDNLWDDNENEIIKPFTIKEKKLLNRKAGKMFAYDADSATSSSSESDYNYNKLSTKEVGDDSRAVLDDKNINDSYDCIPTNRLAIVNCDWDNICSNDIYMIFRSFMPSEGSIIKVSIYPSEYGMKMLKKEQEMGPDANIWKNNKLSNDVKQMENIANFIDANEEQNDNNEEDNNNNNESDTSSSDCDETVKALHEEMHKLEKLEDTIVAIKEGRPGDVLEDEVDIIYNKQALRKYELQKLRYYYAIAEFDSISTCDKLYQQLNGREYRHTCNVLNLSFVDSDFIAPYSARDICIDIPPNYIAASDKQTNALGSTYLELSWDKTDPNRIELCQRTFNDEQLNTMDLEAYLQDDDGITDAGFDTDYPVTEYDTDTPNKKVLIKGKARNRYKDILAEFKQMEKNINNSSDENGNISGTTDDDDDDGLFNINVGNILQKRLKYKQEKLENKIRNVKLRIENLSSSSCDGSDGIDDDEKDINGNKKDTFYIDDEISKLNDWIDTQKRLKVDINNINKNNNLEVKNLKKRKRDSDENIYDNDDDDEPLCIDGDMDDDELNDPYFNQEINLGMGMGIGPPKKKQKLDINNNAKEFNFNEEDKKKRAMLEMMMATNDDIAGKYDPENTEIDKEKLVKSLNKKLKRNWRLRWLIKKKVKEKLKENDTFEFDENDNRFGAIMNDPDFAIDPTNVLFKNSKVMNKLLKNTRKMRLNNKWNKKNKINNNNNKVVNIDSNKLIESLKIKNEKIVKLK